MEQAARFDYSRQRLSVTEIAKRFSVPIDSVYMKELKTKQITEWLVSVGMLQNIIVNNKTRRQPTPQGESVGITTKEWMGQYGVYVGVFYRNKAQHSLSSPISTRSSYSVTKKINKAERMSHCACDILSDILLRYEVMYRKCRF